MNIQKYIEQTILEKLIDKKLITASEIPIYQYGIQLLLVYLINISTFLFIGVIEKRFIEVVIFICTFVFIRCYAGGLHFVNAIHCYLGSTTLIYLFIYLYKLSLPSNVINIFFYLSSILIFIIAPIDNKNKKFDEIEQKYFSRKSKRNIVLVFFIYFFCVHQNFSQYRDIICIATVFNALNIVFAKIIKKYDTHIFL
ncbi:accessory gene regulator B family protein [Enterococcus cecorum]|uniref:accessory gene regulator B family protein n=1 Tax=Enterococcus cecorum TaxID=44008 RepID=UPI00200B56D3|nr:accessory gene regulator B family protein [Enterococcus cecorum]MDZ5601090.1 accessory gene regulator B family protein [Enterococcus cecorum]